MSELYRYILKGNYLPYIKHEKTKIWLELTNDERQFTESFMFPIDYHKNYIKKLEKRDINYWIDYTYDLKYITLNNNLRESLLLTPLMIEWYNNLNSNIVNVPVMNKRCILYRGIKADKFEINGSGVFIWKAFSSCSSIKEISDKFRRGSLCCLFIIIVPENAVLLDVTSIKDNEFEVVLPPGSIMKYLGTINDCIVVRYMGYKTDHGDYYFESKKERDKTLEEEMIRFQ